MYETSTLETARRPTRFDVRFSPAREIPKEVLRGAGGMGRMGRDEKPGRMLASTYDGLSRRLMASDQKVAGHLSRALVEVHDQKLYHREGHVLWSAYLKAFVPLTQRWCQQEMTRERKLRLYPKLAAAFREGRLCKSRVRAILKAVTPQTEDVWLAWGTSFSVRKLETLAQEERTRLKTQGVEAPEGGEEKVSRRRHGRRRSVLAPAGVAVLVAEAVELARKVEGYQVGRGTAIEAMAMEAMSGVDRWPDGVEEKATGQSVSPEGIEGESAGGEASALGDYEELISELGRAWQELHGTHERISGRWRHLSWEFPEVVLEGTLADDADAHQRVVFWSQVQGRQDAVRGRLLRMVRDFGLAKQLGFASLGQYVRERLGLSVREANELIRLDEELSDLPVAFRMYAAGRLKKCAAWLVARAVRLRGDTRAERAWVRFALGHTFRKLEAAVEAAELHRQADWVDFQARGGWPPHDKSFAEVLQTCPISRARTRTVRRPAGRSSR